MKRLLLLLTLLVLFLQNTNAQTNKPTAEQRITDSICNCISKVDLSKVTDKEQATAVITDCFAKNTNLLMQVAEEKHVDPTDNDAMRQVGAQIGKDLFNQNCAAFTRLSVKMAQSKQQTDSGEGYSEGKIKRMDIKSFSYIVITDKNGSEKSFIWLRQFPGSEKFMNGVANYIGKNIKIKYQEMEVYLPQAKGYYKVKEITAIEVL